MQMEKAGLYLIFQEILLELESVVNYCGNIAIFIVWERTC